MIRLEIEITNIVMVVIEFFEKEMLLLLMEDFVEDID